MVSVGIDACKNINNIENNQTVTSGFSPNSNFMLSFSCSLAAKFTESI